MSILPDWLKIPFGLWCFSIIFCCSRNFLPISKICWLDVYFISYASIVLIWHYQDPDFGSLILPFLFLFLYRGISISSYMGIHKIGIISWLSIYGGMGFIALIYSTHLTFSEADFPDRYGGGAYKEMYRSVYR